MRQSLLPMKQTGATRATYLRQEVRERKAAVTRKSPRLTRCRGQKSKCRADHKCDQNGRHYRRSCLVVCRVLENLDEIVTSGQTRVQGLVVVAETEAQCEYNGKSERSIQKDTTYHRFWQDFRGPYHLFRFYWLALVNRFMLRKTYPYDMDHHSLASLV